MPLSLKVIKEAVRKENDYICDVLLAIPNQVLNQRLPFEDDANSDEGEVEEESEVIEERRKTKNRKVPTIQNSKDGARNIPETRRADNLDDLKAILQGKLEKLRGKPMDIHDKKSKKRLNAKMKQLEKRKEKMERKKKNAAKRKAAKNPTEYEEKLKRDFEGLRTNKKVDEQEAEPAIKEGPLMFSQFEDDEDAEPTKVKKGPKDPKQALDVIKKEKAKAKHLEEIGQSDKMMKFDEKKSWSKALSRSQGEKVKDDEYLLKQSIKKKELKKKHSEKKWKERLDNVQKSKDKRQRVRTDNIKARREQKVKKKQKLNRKKRGMQ